MGEDAEPPRTPGERAAIIAKPRSEFPDRLASQWELMADVAGDRDASFQDRESWVPPSLAALVAAVRRTRLTRGRPGRLGRKRRGRSGVRRELARGIRRLPGAVGYGPPGQVIRTLTTQDPDEAAAEAERLLVGWAWSGQES